MGQGWHKICFGQDISDGHMDGRTDKQTNLFRAPSELNSNKMNISYNWWKLNIWCISKTVLIHLKNQNAWVNQMYFYRNTRQTIMYSYKYQGLFLKYSIHGKQSSSFFFSGLHLLDVFLYILHKLCNFLIVSHIISYQIVHLIRSMMYCNLVTNIKKLRLHT